jgi:PAS domain S-box-containing protein
MTLPNRGIWAMILGGVLSRNPRAQLYEDTARLLLDLPLGVLLLTDEAQRVRYSNGAVLRFLGYSQKDVLGTPLAELFGPAARPGLTRLVEDQVPGDPATAGEFPGVRKDGTVVPLQVVVQSAVIRGRKLSGVYLRDFSEREKLVEALAQRGAELARSNRELEQFTYIASHDLQEPLRMVGSYTQLLEQRYASQLDDDAREFLRYAQEGASRMRDLINALLAYSRLDTQVQDFRRISMDQVLTLSVANLRESISSTNAEVTRGPMPEVDGDPVQLGQVLQNLIGNSLKFHGPEPPHVWVEAERRGPEWRFSVRDDGIGILPEYQERIFIMFQRLHSREEYPGTGIGLAVCKKVVERHGGKLWVESTGRPGEGTSFFFTLPVDRESLPQAPKKEADVATSQSKVEAMSMIEDRLKELV